MSAIQYSRSDLLAALEARPAFAVSLAGHLAAELMAMRSRSELAAIRKVSERLDAWMALNDCRPPSRGRLRHLADELGVTPEALYRELSRRRRLTGAHFSA